MTDLSNQPKSYFVYILGSQTGTIYTGVTNDLERRVAEDKVKQLKGFTRKYNITRLLYFEEFSRIDDSIAAEKQIKGWLRAKKLELIRSLNPDFRDLSEDWF